jgi:hypothetical protein
MNEEYKKNLMEKLLIIEKEKNSLVCESIKLSTKLMSKLLTSFSIHQNNEEENINIENNHNLSNEILIKLKLFLKITRLVQSQTKEEIENSNEEKNKFFSM